MGVRKLIFFGLSLIVCFCLSGCQKEKTVEKKEEIKTVRKPAVAGAFYPAGKENLENQIEGFLNNLSSLEEKKDKLRILIAPHAGYDYSGQVAAFGFREIKRGDYQTVILLGSSHKAGFQGGAIDNHDFWETPLGKVVIDQSLAQEIVKACSGVSFSSSVHAQEHSLEVEVPFLQERLGEFKLVPLLLGQTDPAFLEELVQVLVEKIDDKTLIVVSSDFSHYPSYQTANQVDSKTIEAILTGDHKVFEKTISHQMEENHPNLVTCACGEKAIQIGMILAEKLGFSEIELLNYANSGDVGGDKDRVVGYAAIGFYGEFEKKNADGKDEEDLLDKEAQEEALQIARQTLENHLQGKNVPPVKVENEALNRKLGAFVTLTKQGRLRGCIGRFEPDEPLFKIIQEMAVSAAIEDPRFSPVESQELEEIKIEISVLSPRRKIDSWKEIEVGKHGVYLQKGRRGGVFLPQVATDNDWELETFMGTLCSQKAGLPQNCWKQEDVDLFVFTAQVFEEDW